ncbi:sensor histidine kinase [Streptomyces hokutonensis]|uniref:sensor histidine kinase n=1 Tax=Streptomyces hokutonensis TaxID=1306990 RepID=UPI00381C863B
MPDTMHRPSASASTAEAAGLRPSMGRDLMNSLVGRVRRGIESHPLATDTALSLAVALASLPALGASGRPWMAVPLCAGLVAPLVWRRRWPSAVFGFLSVVAFVTWLVDVRTDMANASLLIGLYTVGRWQARINAFLAASVLEIGAVLAVGRWGHDSAQPALVVFVLLSGMVAAALLLGIYIRTRGAYLASLRDRAERAERERDQLARLAVVEERARIAREMHDIVAHNLSVLIALVDGAASVQTRTPHQATQAMALAADTGRKVLGEMRQLLDVTRTEPGEAELHPQPGLEDLDGLVDEVRAVGLPVTVEMTGPRIPVPASTGLAAYRVVQESLTNVLKHAGTAAAAHVRLEFTSEALKITVTDTGDTTAETDTQNLSAPPGHHGLAGMRERVAVHGGAVQAGSHVGGGWQVNACLPWRADPTRSGAS